jgi:diacylglycerol kinase
MIKIKKEIRSFKCAFKGIYYAVQTETHIRVHIIIAIIVCGAGFLFKISATEWALCLLCMGSVIGAELINTSIEKMIDLISPKYNELAGRAKDIAAGAVLVFAVISVLVGILVFVPKILWSPA